MSQTRRGLGKGLGALISERQSTSAAGTSAENEAQDLVYREIDPGDIAPNPRQPRTTFDEDAMAELVYSIGHIGLLQPVVVRPVTGGLTPYELVAGERRWRACQKLGMSAIPVIVRPTEDDDLLRDALLENLHRAQLNPLDEAAAYAQLLADFGGTQDELAQRLGRSRPQVANTLRLLKLPPSVQTSVAAGVISAGHARALLGLNDEEQITALAQRIVAEGLSVRTVEEIVLLHKDSTGSKRRKKSPRGPSEAMIDAQLAVSTRLGDRLDTRVSLAGARTPKARGKIMIEFADLDDLLRILNTLDPQDED